MKKSWILELHKRFSIIYLTKFTTSFQDTESIDDWCEVWAEHLANLTGDQLKFGISRITKQCNWPPTMGEFKGYCNAMSLPTVPSLPAPRLVKTEAGFTAMKEITAVLSRSKPPNKDWAHRIIAKAERGEFVLPICLDFARQAVSQYHSGALD